MAPRAFHDRVRRLAGWGVDFIQVREKDLSDMALCRMTERILRLVHDTRCRVIVNGRADIALACGAHGVHLPSMGFGVLDLKVWLPAKFLVGISAHSMAQARKARDSGADYVILGPVFQTPAKIQYGPPLGLETFRKICRRVDVPVFGIGGISWERIPSVLHAGAAGIAAIRLFQEGSALNFREKRALRSG